MPIISIHTLQRVVVLDIPSPDIVSIIGHKSQDMAIVTNNIFEWDVLHLSLQTRDILLGTNMCDDDNSTQFFCFYNNVCDLNNQTLMSIGRRSVKHFYEKKAYHGYSVGLRLFNLPPIPCSMLRINQYGSLKLKSQLWRGERDLFHMHTSSQYPTHEFLCFRWTLGMD